MAIFLYLICLLWFVAGIGMLVLPEKIQKLYERIAKIKNFAVFAVVPIVLGILFFLSSGSVFFPTLVQVLGVLAILKGLVTLVVKREKVIEVLQWWLTAPVLVIRFWGIFILALAVILFRSII